MTSPDPVSDLEQLIVEFKRSGLRELHGKYGDLEVYLSMDADSPGPVAAGPRGRIETRAEPVGRVAAPATAAPATAAPALEQGGKAAAPAGALDLPVGATVVRAPYLGTFYRSPKPGAAPYVDIGARVAADSELCLVEVMKLFTAVRAGVAGKVGEVLASDGELVAADQPLFVILPE